MSKQQFQTVPSLFAKNSSVQYVFKILMLNGAMGPASPVINNTVPHNRTVRYFFYALCKTHFTVCTRLIVITIIILLHEILSQLFEVNYCSRRTINI